MNSVFHKTAPRIALNLMPEVFQEFMLSGGYTLEQMGIDATISDAVDKDNITINADIHHAHSYKLEEKDGQLHWADGDCLERLKALSADAHDFKAEGKLDMVRYALAKMTHYRVDALTYPHLHRGKPWNLYHEKFETQMGQFIMTHANEVGELKFSPVKDIYKAARITAIDAWYQGRDLVAIYESGGRVSDEQALEICRNAVQAIGDLWLTIGAELKII